MKDLMPKSIANIHDSLIDNMLRRGYCKYIEKSFKTYALNKNGFIFPITI